MAGTDTRSYYQSREEIKTKLGEARHTIGETIIDLRRIAGNISSEPRSMRWILRDQILRMARDLEAKLSAAYREDRPPYGRSVDRG